VQAQEGWGATMLPSVCVHHAWMRVTFLRRSNTGAGREVHLCLSNAGAGREVHLCLSYAGAGREVHLPAFVSGGALQLCVSKIAVRVR